MFAFARIRKVLSIHDIMHETNSCPAAQLDRLRNKCPALSWKISCMDFFSLIRVNANIYHGCILRKIKMGICRNGCVGAADMYFNDVLWLFVSHLVTGDIRIIRNNMHLAKRMRRIYHRNNINLRSECEANAKRMRSECEANANISAQVQIMRNEAKRMRIFCDKYSRDWSEGRPLLRAVIKISWLLLKMRIKTVIKRADRLFPRVASRNNRRAFLVFFSFLSCFFKSKLWKANSRDWGPLSKFARHFLKKLINNHCKQSKSVFSQGRHVRKIVRRFLKNEPCLLKIIKKTEKIGENRTIKSVKFRKCETDLA